MLATVPVGVWEGVPSLTVTSATTAIDRPDVFTEILPSRRAPGVRALVLDLSDEVWGGEVVGVALHRLTATDPIEPWCLRKLGCRGWTYVPVRWVCDLSPVLDRARSMPEILDIIGDMMAAAPFPPPTELYIGPMEDPRNIVPAVLDELHTRLQCEELGFIYADRENYIQARHAVMHAATPWVVRHAR